LSWHLIAEAERLAYADRAQYLADPDFVRVPTQGLIDPAYIKSRSLLIDPERAAQGVRAPGIPPMAGQSGAVDTSLELPGTTHLTIVDRFGDVAAMSATIENPFGSNLMAAGFLLNNELTDFSPIPSRDGKPVANVAAPGKRPMSSMSPMIVFDDSGRIVMAIGSPGGRRIIGYVVKTLIAVLDWNLPMQEAIDLPNVLNPNGPTEIEASLSAGTLAAALEAKGHTIKVMQGEESGLQGFRVVPAGYEAAADHRREGSVEGGRTWWPWRWIRNIFR
jgi:gamma-glutamyltranspeptidase/glutathione hydrolase